MSSSSPGFSERITAALLGALFGCVVGLAIAWLLMFSSTLHLLGIGTYSVSFAKSAAAGAVFFATAGAVIGSSVGSLVGNVLAGLFEFERFFDTRNPSMVELVVLIVGLGIVLWVNGVFAA